MTYSEKLKDPRWQKKRLEVLNRDQWKCRDCECESKTLHVHHCAYAKGAPWDTPIGLLLTLCEDCHETRQQMEDDARLMLGSIMANTWCISTLVKSIAKVATQQEILEIYSDNDVINHYEHGFKNGAKSKRK